jgi:uroporphyrinogen decarboxylase
VSHRSTVFERAWELVGMERLLVMMVSEPEAVDGLFERIIQFQLGIARQYLELKPDLAVLGDDLGTQLGLFFSPALFRRYLKPRYARLVDLYRSSGVLVEFHSCGNVLGLVDDFLDLGIDILNPIQPRAIGDLALLRRKTAGRMALRGGVDTQYTLTLGTPAEVRAEVRERIGSLGRQGGYICGPDQTIPMPAENVVAFESAVADFGRYPLG